MRGWPMRGGACRRTLSRMRATCRLRRRFNDLSGDRCRRCPHECKNRRHRPRGRPPHRPRAKAATASSAARHAVDVHDAIDRGGALEADHELAELAAERDFGQRAVTVADGDETKRRAGDQRVARFADAGGEHDADVRVGERRVGVGQHSDGEPPAARGAAADRLHHALPPAADDGEAHRREPRTDTLGGGELGGRSPRAGRSRRPGPAAARRSPAAARRRRRRASTLSPRTACRRRRAHCARPRIERCGRRRPTGSPARAVESIDGVHGGSRTTRRWS